MRTNLSVSFITPFDITTKLLSLIQSSSMRDEMILKHLLIRKFHITSKTPWPMCIPFMSLHIQQLNKSLLTFIAEVFLRMSFSDVLS